MEDLVVVGDYIEHSELELMKSRLALSIDANELLTKWRRCSLTAEFLGKYHSLFFDTGDAISSKDAENSVSFILNELIENVAKYSDKDKKTDVLLQVFIDGVTFIFEVRNYILKEDASSFSVKMEETLKSDISELYIEKLEENMLNDTESGMGFLTLMNDYEVDFSFKFVKDDDFDDLFVVSVQAKMNLDQ